MATLSKDLQTREQSGGGAAAQGRMVLRPGPAQLAAPRSSGHTGAFALTRWPWAASAYSPSGLCRGLRIQPGVSAVPKPSATPLSLGSEQSAASLSSGEAGPQPSCSCDSTGGLAVGTAWGLTEDATRVLLSPEQGARTGSPLDPAPGQPPWPPHGPFSLPSCAFHSV